MDKIVIVLTLMGVPGVHAFGPFRSMHSCWAWADLMNRNTQAVWLGRCLPMEEFRREFPSVTIGEGS